MSNIVSNPQVSLSLISADTTASNAPQKVLIVGIKDASGTATSGALVENLPNDGSETIYFGEASMVTDMVRAFKKIAPSVQLDVIPLAENAGGTAAVYTLAFTGPATEAGSIEVVVGSEKNAKYTVSVANAATATTIANNVRDAINNNTRSLFTASATTGTVTLTCIHKGTVGNWIPIGIKLNGAVAGVLNGVGITIANTVPGATDPTGYTSNTLFDVCGNNRYQGVVWPSASTITTATAWLEARFNANNKVLDGVAFSHKTDTYGNCLASAAGNNSKCEVLFVDKMMGIASSYLGPAGREPGFVVSSSFAAVRALRLTSGAAISQYITTSSSSDQFGGPALSSLPYFNTTIPTLSRPASGHGFTETEIASLEAQGASIIGQNINKTNVLVGTVRMTYKTDPAGNPDPSWKYLNYVDTMSNVREYFFNNYKKRFAQSRLTEGTVLRGRDMVNRAVFEAYTDQLYGDLSGPSFALVQAGEDAVKFFKKNRFVTLDLETGTINVAMLVPIVTQVRTIVGTIKIAFSTEG